MTKLSIGLDLDGVVANWNRGFHWAFIEHANETPEPLSAEQLMVLGHDENITVWSFAQDVVGEKNWEWFWSVAVPNYRVMARQPAYYPNVDEAAALCDAHGVFMITTRPSSVRNETYEWISDHQLRPQAVIHVDHKVARGHGGGQDKATMIKALDLVAMLEDNADTAVAVAEQTGAYSCLLDRPWNQHLETDGERIIRVFSVAQYQQIVEELFQ